MEPSDGLERAIEQLHMTTRAETDKRILDDAFATLLRSASKQRSGIKADGWRMPAIRRIAVPVAVAAAVLVAFALFINVPSRKTATLRQIQAVLSKADNICISTFRAGETEPFRQVWASRALDLTLSKIGRGKLAQFTLWDVPNRTRRTKYLSSGYIQTETIPEPMLAELKKSEAESFGLVPFSDANGVPEATQWSPLEDPEVAAAMPGAKVYDLTWPAKSTSAEAGTLKKLRLFVDTRTSLPKRAEWYTQLPTEDEYGFEIFAVVSYHSENDIQSLVRTTFGPRGSDDPERIGTPGAER
jgi:hypothetical protein